MTSVQPIEPTGSQMPGVRHVISAEHHEGPQYSPVAVPGFATTVWAGSRAEALLSQMMFTFVIMVGENCVEAYSKVTPTIESPSRIAVTTGVFDVPVGLEKSPARGSH